MNINCQESHRQLVVLGIYPWGYTQLNDTVRSMVAALQSGSTIFLNPTVLRKKFQLIWEKEQMDGVQVWNPPFHFLPTRYGGERFQNRFKRLSLEPELRKSLGADWRENAVFYVTPSTLEQSYEYIHYLKPKHLIFDVLDDNIGFPALTERKRKIMKQKFIELADQASIITAVSTYLVEQTKAWTGKEVHYLPNGVDIERFRSNPAIQEPVDMKGIAHPKITFVGAITGWIDIELMEKIARAYSDYQLVLVGPIDETAIDNERFQSLRSLKNVHVLGAKSFQEVPAYMHASDVLILPRTMDPYSLACDPIKLYEYLATGKPVVSTAHPSAERFSNDIYIGRTHEEFVQAVGQASHSKETDPEHFENLVRDLTWETRAEKLLQLIDAIN